MSDAIARYQAENDLVPNGRVDFDLYYRMLAGGARPTASSQTASSQAGPVTPVVAPVAPPVAPPLAAEPPRISLVSTRGPRPSYRVGDMLALRFQPTQDAYVYCYYRDAGGAVARIFPNRFQPDAFTPARTAVTVPPANAGAFDIRLDQAGGRESVACLAADREVGLRLPDALKAQDLQPLPVGSLDEVAAQFRAIPGARVDAAELVVEVGR
jgi:hypothetical protein